MNAPLLLPLAIGLAVVWIGTALALSLAAARKLRLAAALLGEAHGLRALLQAAPALPLLLHTDGRIEGDSALARELRLDALPERLGDLAGEERGLVAADLAALTAAVRTAAATGQQLVLPVRIAGSSRVLEVRGGPPPPPAATGTMLLWWFDASAAESQKAELASRLHQTEGALDALTHLIEAAPFPMWYRGPDLSLGLVNSAYVAAVEGRDAADVIARSSELVDTPAEDSARAGALAAIEAGRPLSRTQPATIGGERRMLRIVDVPLPTGAVAGFAIDIQDLEDARFELAETIESQRELADRMTAGTAQFDADRSLIFFNQPFAMMAGLDVEWLAEQPEFDRLLERMREQHRLPEVRDFPAWKAERRSWFTSPIELIEEDWILANGDHLRVVAQPLPDGGLRLIVEDRTEQVRLASARDTLLRVRAATLDNLFEAISVFAGDGRLYLWNLRFSNVWQLDQSLLGEHPRIDELLPAMAERLANPTASAKLRELVRQATSERRQGSARMSMADGRHFEVAAVPLPDGNALFTMIDVTDSTRIQSALHERAAALEEADRVKTDFVANMSYELRTPLTSIGGFAEMLAGGYAGELAPSAADYVAAILESVARLSKLIDDVLDLTQADRAGVPIERRRVELAELCRSAAETLQRRVAGKHQALDIAIADSTGSVIGDARRLRESIEHVLRNAVDYSEPGGHIVLTAKGDADAASITISDDGPGIDHSDQQRVFLRFDRIGARAGSDAALGLGLPLTRQFIEAHGGTVKLVSAPGEGTSVTLTIPREPPSPRAPQ